MSLEERQVRAARRFGRIGLGLTLFWLLAVPAIILVSETNLVGVLLPLYVVGLGLHVWRIRQVMRSLGSPAPTWFVLCAAAVGLALAVIGLTSAYLGFMWALVSGVLLGDIVGGKTARRTTVWVLGAVAAVAVLRLDRGHPRPARAARPRHRRDDHRAPGRARVLRRRRGVLRRLLLVPRRRAPLVAQGRHRHGRLPPARRRARHRPRAVAPRRRPARHPRPRAGGRRVQERAGQPPADRRSRAGRCRDGGGPAGGQAVAARGALARPRDAVDRSRHRARRRPGRARLGRCHARRHRRPRRDRTDRTQRCSAGCCARP